MHHDTLPPPRLAAPAPTCADDDADDVVGDKLLADQAEQHRLCEAWAAWCRTRRFYGRPGLSASTLGRLTSSTRATGGGGPNAIASAELSALHLAVISQPADALDRQVFELHYLWRVRNVKAAAAELGIGRAHWYRLVAQFRQRVWTASREILESNLGTAALLPHYLGSNR